MKKNGAFFSLTSSVSLSLSLSATLANAFFFVPRSDASKARRGQRGEEEGRKTFFERAKRTRKLSNPFKFNPLSSIFLLSLFPCPLPVPRSLPVSPRSRCALIPLFLVALSCSYTVSYRSLFVCHTHSLSFSLSLAHSLTLSTLFATRLTFFLSLSLLLFPPSSQRVHVQLDRPRLRPAASAVPVALGVARKRRVEPERA